MGMTTFLQASEIRLIERTEWLNGGTKEGQKAEAQIEGNKERRTRKHEN